MQMSKKIRELKMFIDPVVDVFETLTIEILLNDGRKFSKRVQVPQDDFINQFDYWINRLKNEFKDSINEDSDHYVEKNWQEPEKC